MSEFHTVYGRGLVRELVNFVHRPRLVVTMEDLWPMFARHLDDAETVVHLVRTLDVTELSEIESEIPLVNAVIGLGGGQAIDVAKYFAWRRRLPLFQVPTSMTVNAPFGHRAGLRVDGHVRYLGWAVPEAVYVDFDVIQSAPAALNRAGVGDILCYHTAHHDWRLASELGRGEARWPFDPGMQQVAQARLDSVLGHLDDIREVNETGIRVLMEAHRWGGATFHDSGWNPRHIEGVEHFFFYNLEKLTGRHFIHGQPVGLGIAFGSLLQDNRPDDLLAALFRVGVDIRPEAMGITWEQASEAMLTLPAYIKEAGLWFSVADVRPITTEIVEDVRERVESMYGRLRRE